MQAARGGATRTGPGYCSSRATGIAADALAVALLNTYGRWPQLDGVGGWREREIRRAVQLGLGATGPGPSTCG
jgi:hypothetical protein